MDIIHPTLLENSLKNAKYFDLTNLNNKYDSIVILDDDIESEIDIIFNKFIKKEDIDNGFYTLKNLFAVQSPQKIINTIINLINNKNDIFVENITQELNLSKYIQIWSDYKSFCRDVYEFVNIYQDFLTKKGIDKPKYGMSILSVLQRSIFYQKIINRPGIFIHDEMDLSGINRHNIDQLLDYLNSLKSVISIKNSTNLKTDWIHKKIKNIVSNVKITNHICEKINDIIMKIKINDDEAATCVEKNTVNKNIININHMLSLLNQYGDSTLVYILYNKYMQTRIVYSTDLELETKFVSRLADILGKMKTQKMFNIIGDVYNSRKFHKKLSGIKINISQKYQNIETLDVNKITALLLSRDTWTISNKSEMDPIYPLELQYCLDLVNKVYRKLSEDQYEIVWQPTMGTARFATKLGGYDIDINCNTMQAMALLYLNENKQCTSKSFSDDLNINYELGEKIFESLIDSNLVVLHNNKIIVNTHYTGDTDVDLVKYFVEAFEKNAEDIDTVEV